MLLIGVAVAVVLHVDPCWNVEAVSVSPVARLRQYKVVQVEVAPGLVVAVCVEVGLELARFEIRLSAVLHLLCDSSVVSVEAAGQVTVVLLRVNQPIADDRLHEAVPITTVNLPCRVLCRVLLDAHRQTVVQVRDTEVKERREAVLFDQVGALKLNGRDDHQRREHKERAQQVAHR